MFNYIFLQYIEVANRTKLQPLRLEFAKRILFLFSFVSAYGGQPFLKVTVEKTVALLLQMPMLTTLTRPIIGMGWCS